MVLQANAWDEQGIDRVGFYLDGGTLLGTAKQAPYTSTWDTLTQSTGYHVLEAVAFNASGQAQASTQVRIYVAND